MPSAVNKLYIGIDPDLRTMNVAIVTENKVPVAVFVRRNKTPQVGHGAVAASVKTAFSLMQDVVTWMDKEYSGFERVLVTESQNMQQAIQYRRVNRKIDLEDILHLGQVAGIMMGVFGEWVSTVHLIPASVWKGQVPKQIHQGRIYNRLDWLTADAIKVFTPKGTIYPENISNGIGQYSFDKINPGDFEDINDSLGLALFGAENRL